MESQQVPCARMWKTAIQSDGSRRYSASSLAVADATAQGDGSFARRKTAPLSRTTFSVSDRTSIGCSRSPHRQCLVQQILEPQSTFSEPQSLSWAAQPRILTL